MENRLRNPLKKPDNNPVINNIPFASQQRNASPYIPPMQYA